MYNIMTKQDLLVLLSASDTKKSKTSPIPDSAETIGKEETERSNAALSKLGFLEDGKLSAKGNLISDALLSPEDMVITANSALLDSAPVSYCYKHGFWTVLAPDIRANLITVVSPIFQQDVQTFVRQNICYDLPIPPFEAFEITLTNAELLLFELTQLTVIHRFKEKKAPLTKEESWFSAEDFLSENAVFYFLSAADYMTPDQRESLSALLGDESQVKKALAGLTKKGVLEMRGKNQSTSFIHTALSHKWLMADALLDRVSLYHVTSEKAATYNITKAGILKIKDQKDQVIFKSVLDFDLSMFER